jgi:DNA-binding XRE family transcriptional regulator
VVNVFAYEDRKMTENMENEAPAQLTEQELDAATEQVFRSICDQIKDERISKIGTNGRKLTQGEAAQLAGVHARTPSTIENAENTNIKTIIRYVLGMGTTFEEIVVKASIKREIEERQEAALAGLRKA